MKTLEERFWSKVDKKSEDECWGWFGSKRNGYGRIYSNDKKSLLSAHRVSWEIHNGKLKDDIKVCHHCDNPSCVNPAHLFLGTQNDNVQDMIKKGHHRFPIGEKVHTARLTLKEAEHIRDLYSSKKMTRKEIAEFYSMSKSAVAHIIHRRSWR